MIFFQLNPLTKKKLLLSLSAYIFTGLVFFLSTSVLWADSLLPDLFVCLKLSLCLFFVLVFLSALVADSLFLHCFYIYICIFVLIILTFFLKILQASETPYL